MWMNVCMVDYQCLDSFWIYVYARVCMDDCVCAWVTVCNLGMYVCVSMKDWVCNFMCAFIMYG